MSLLSRTLQHASLLLLFSIASPTPAQAARCPDLPVEVHAATPEAMGAICPAASSALEFLAVYGMAPTGVIPIDLVERSLEHYGYIAFGSYDRGTGRVSLMSMRAIDGLDPLPSMYGEPFDRVHYRGAVAHEIAHAVFHQNSPHARLSNAAQEYLAHVTQMAVLPEPRRRQVIERADVSAWESGDSISEIYMAMAPEKFAVKSYLHFTGMAEPEAFVQILLNVKWFYVYAP